MRVLRIFEWHYLYISPELFKYKDQLPPCNIWFWSTYLYNVYLPLLCTGYYFRYFGHMSEQIEKKKNLQALPSWCLHAPLLHRFCKFTPSWFLSLTPLPANIPYMLMFSESLLTFFSYIIFLCNILGFNYFLYVDVALKSMSSYLWPLSSILFPCALVLTLSLWKSHPHLTHNMSWIKYYYLFFLSKKNFSFHSAPFFSLLTSSLGRKSPNINVYSLSD